MLHCLGKPNGSLKKREKLISLLLNWLFNLRGCLKSTSFLAAHYLAQFICVDTILLPLEFGWMECQFGVLRT